MSQSGTNPNLEPDVVGLGPSTDTVASRVRRFRGTPYSYQSLVPAAICTPRNQD